MDNHGEKFALIVNLKRAPLDKIIYKGLLKDIIQVVEKYKILDELNYIEIFRIKIEPTKGVDA